MALPQALKLTYRSGATRLDELVAKPGNRLDQMVSGPGSRSAIGNLMVKVQRAVSGIWGAIKTTVRNPLRVPRAVGSRLGFSGTAATIVGLAAMLFGYRLYREVVS